MAVSLELKDLKVTSLDIDFHEVTWKIQNTTEDVLDYNFRVLRSEAEEGPYEALTPPFEDKYHFVDNVIQVAHRWRRYVYKVVVTNKVSGKTKEFGPVALEPPADLIAAELRRHLRLVFQEFAGRRCIVLPVRTFGQRCSCFDTKLNKKTRSGCDTCFDTGFVRGYLHPIESWISVDPSAKTKQVSSTTAVTHQSNTTMRLGYYPMLKPDDLIIEGENRRWRVITQNQTEHSRASIYQELSVHELEPRDISFKIPVHFSDALPNLFLAPSRNFTNPHNLSNFENEELPGIFDIYRVE